ncbi:hypothetical protein [Maricaulis sp.]|jgi:hypothetical protein|uniref:hypothetical protein n=1 Tax=Maricaulis sp. TaxID=1486257 RepID=UPI0026036B10|nr:hypothetical protein [Maricaulis sp.]MDF1768956.1 hypothetical protein [Maricaulis sp.]
MTDTRDNSLRSLLIAAIAGGAGTVLAARLGSGIWFGASFALESYPHWLGLALPPVIATLFALAVSFLLGSRLRVMAALIGYWVIATAPILISIPAHLLLGGENPAEFAQLRLVSLVPMGLTLLVPSAAFLLALVFVSGKRA